MGAVIDAALRILKEEGTKFLNKWVDNFIFLRFPQPFRIIPNPESTQGLMPITVNLFVPSKSTESQTHFENQAKPLFLLL